MPRRMAIVFGAALLAGCAAPGRISGTNPDTWSGRLALRVDSTPPQAFSAGFDLQGSPLSGELRLSSPLGNTLATVRWSPSGAELQRGNDVTRRGNLDELTTELTGAALPVASLFSWLRGSNETAAGWQADLSAHADGRLFARREQPAPIAELRVVFQP